MKRRFALPPGFELIALVLLILALSVCSEGEPGDATPTPDKDSTTDNVEVSEQAPPGQQVPYDAEFDPDLEAAILDASPDYTREIIGDGLPGARYVYSSIDLNDDGTDEVMVYLLGLFFCGTGGCNLLLFKRSVDGYAQVDNLPISRTPVSVSRERTHGWRHLLRLESGGGVPPSYVEHIFDGEKYSESQRMPATPEPDGTRVLAGEVTYDAGIPLEPGE